MMDTGKAPSDAQVAKYLKKLLGGRLTTGNRTAIERTIQIVKGER